MKRAIIDRFEGDYAVCELEDGSFADIELKLLPKNAREGDVIIITSQGIEIDTDATIKRRERIDRLIDDMWE